MCTRVCSCLWKNVYVDDVRMCSVIKTICKCQMYVDYKMYLNNMYI